MRTIRAEKNGNGNGQPGQHRKPSGKLRTRHIAAAPENGDGGFIYAEVSHSEYAAIRKAVFKPGMTPRQLEDAIGAFARCACEDKICAMLTARNGQGNGAVIPGRELSVASSLLWQASFELSAVLHAASIHYNSHQSSVPGDEAAALAECGKDWPSLSQPVRKPAAGAESQALGLAMAAQRTEKELLLLLDEIHDRCVSGYIPGEPSPFRGMAWNELRGRVTAAGRKAVLLANMTADGFLNAVEESGPQPQKENARDFVALAWDAGNVWRAAQSAFDRACENIMADKITRALHNNDAAYEAILKDLIAGKISVTKACLVLKSLNKGYVTQLKKMKSIRAERRGRRQLAS